MENSNIIFRATIFLFLATILGSCITDKAIVRELPSMNVDVKDYTDDKQRPTTIEVLYPKNHVATDKPEIGVVASIHAGEPIKTVALFVNDELIKKIDLRSRGRTLRDRIPLDVPTPLSIGNNKISIIATTDQNKIIEKTIDIKRVKAAEARSFRTIQNRWAVVIGISKYLNADRGIPPLQFAHRDAIAFMDFLQSPQGGGFASSNTKLLVNEQATTRNIRSALFTFLKQAGKDDLVFIYFAGHGAPEAGRPDNLYLLSYDTDIDDMASTAFPMWDMETALKRYITAERVVVFADACHSAGVGGEAGFRSVGNTNLINTYLSNLQKTKPGRATITASEANELSREGKEWGDHGVFTYYLLKALKGEADLNDNGIVTITEAFNYVNNKVRRSTNSQQHPNIQGEFDHNLPLSVIK
jgi:hypothetical protein